MLSQSEMCVCDIATLLQMGQSAISHQLRVLKQMRLVSFRRAARRGMKIVVGTVPVFLVAGFIESFLTRHTHAPAVLRFGRIALSAAFIAYYYIYLPKKRIYGNNERTRNRAV